MQHSCRAFIIGQAWKRLNTTEPWVQFTIIAVSSLANSLSIVALSWIMQRNSNGIIFGAALIQSLVTAFITIVFFTVLEIYKHNRTNKAH